MLAFLLFGVAFGKVFLYADTKIQFRKLVPGNCNYVKDEGSFIVYEDKKFEFFGSKDCTGDKIENLGTKAY